MSLTALHVCQNFVVRICGIERSKVERRIVPVKKLARASRKHDVKCSHLQQCKLTGSPVEIGTFFHERHAVNRDPSGRWGDSALDTATFTKYRHTAHAAIQAKISIETRSIACVSVH